MVYYLFFFYIFFRQDYAKFAFQADLKISKEENKKDNSVVDAIRKEKQQPKDNAGKVNAVENDSKPKPQKLPLKQRKRKAQQLRYQESSQRLPNQKPLQARFEEFRRGIRQEERQSQSRFGDRRQNINPWQPFSHPQDKLYEERDRYNERGGTYNERGGDRYFERERMGRDRYVRQENSFNDRQNNSFNDRQNNSFSDIRNSIFNDNGFSISQFQNTLFDTGKIFPNLILE